MNKKTPTRKKGRKGEQVAKDSINSGALWFAKGDIKYDNCLVEVKTTEKKSFGVTKRLLEKVSREAYAIKKEPLIVIVFPEFIVECHVKQR